MYIYWTGESIKNDALMEFSFNKRYIESATEYFTNVANLIQNKRFEISKKPAMNVCHDCDFRTYCGSQGTIRYKPKHQKLMQLE